MSIGEIVSSLALVISALAFLRTLTRDGREDSNNMTTVIVKLENIGEKITDVKKEISSVALQVREHGERLARAEQKIKALSEKIDLYHHEETP